VFAPSPFGEGWGGVKIKPCQSKTSSPDKESQKKNFNVHANFAKK